MAAASAVHTVVVEVRLATVAWVAIAVIEVKVAIEDASVSGAVRCCPSHAWAVSGRSPLSRSIARLDLVARTLDFAGLTDPRAGSGRADELTLGLGYPLTLVVAGSGEVTLTICGTGRADTGADTLACTDERADFIGDPLALAVAGLCVQAVALAGSRLTDTAAASSRADEGTGGPAHPLALVIAGPWRVAIAVRSSGRACARARTSSADEGAYFIGDPLALVVAGLCALAIALLAPRVAGSSTTSGRTDEGTGLAADPLALTVTGSGSVALAVRCPWRARARTTSGRAEEGAVLSSLPLSLGVAGLCGAADTLIVVGCAFGRTAALETTEVARRLSYPDVVDACAWRVAVAVQFTWGADRRRWGLWGVFTDAVDTPLVVSAGTAGWRIGVRHRSIVNGDWRHATSCPTCSETASSTHACETVIRHRIGGVGGGVRGSWVEGTTPNEGNADQS